MRVERWLMLGAAILYLASLALPAVRGSGFPDLSGLEMLRRGAGAWRDGVVAWYANPALWLAMILLWCGLMRSALAAAGVGLALGLSSFGAASLASRSGRSVPEFAYAVGFYVWLAALVLVLAAGLYGIYKVSSTRPG